MPLSITCTKIEQLSYASSHKDVTFVAYETPIPISHNGKVRNLKARKYYMAHYEFLMDEFQILHTPKNEYYIIDYVYGL